MTVEEGDEGINGGEPPFGEHGVSTVAVADVLQPLSHRLMSGRRTCRQGEDNECYQNPLLFHACKDTIKRGQYQKETRLFLNCRAKVSSTNVNDTNK